MEERLLLGGFGREEIGEVEALYGVVAIGGLVDESVREQRDHVGRFGGREGLGRQRRPRRRRRERGRRRRRSGSEKGREERRLEERGGLELAGRDGHSLDGSAILDAREEIERLSAELERGARTELFRRVDELVEKKRIALGGYGSDAVDRLEVGSEVFGVVFELAKIGLDRAMGDLRKERIVHTDSVVNIIDMVKALREILRENAFTKRNSK